MTPSTSCLASETVCSPDGGASYCANTQSDNANCGTCGTTCTAQQSCTAGKCVALSGGCGANETTCTPDGGASYCANTQSDNANCGACGTACVGQQSCIAGKCTAPSSTCSADELVCGGDGGAADGGATYCANTQVDISNCGACGAVCGSTHATPECLKGKCTEVCATGYSNCDNNAANGCEVQTATDVNNCGTCGNACAAGIPCSQGVCQYPECTTALPYNADGFTQATPIGGGTGEENLGTTPQWYRFTGSSHDMLTSAPVLPDAGASACGAGVMGWLNLNGGALPTGGATTSAEVCFSGGTSAPCFVSTTIQVTNCGTYNVYQIMNPDSIPDAGVPAAASYCMQ